MHRLEDILVHKPYSSFTLRWVTLSSLLFWSLRIAYWSITSEAPFSDSLGYIQVADNILHSFFFGLSDRYPTYWTPVTPSFIAVAKLLSSSNFVWVFRAGVQLLAFFGALFAALELNKVTGKRILGCSFLFIVAICRPSIFWSLKVSTEPVQEALLYVALGLVLYAMRCQRRGWIIAAGTVCFAAGLNRPNYIPGMLFVALAFAVPASPILLSIKGLLGVRSQIGVHIWRTALPSRAAVVNVCFFLLGFFLLWSTWITRGLVNYGTFIPTSSSSLISANWDYAGAPVRIGRYEKLQLADGSRYSDFNLPNLVRHADAIPTEAERVKWLGMIANAWYRENFWDLPRVFVWRLKQLVAARGPNGFTTVSREDLFPAPTPGYNNSSSTTSWLNLLLLDKTPTACFAALVGLAIMIWSNARLGTLFIGLALIPWFSGALVLGYERIVEPAIALTIWLAFFALAVTARSIGTHIRRNTSRFSRPFA